MSRGLDPNIFGNILDTITVALRPNDADGTAVIVRNDLEAMVLLFSVPIVLDDLDFESQLIPLPESESDAK
jgi:hypothetical protein